MISDLPLIAIMFHDARILAAETSSSNHDWSYLKQPVWLSSLLLEQHDLIREAQPHHERAPFSPLSFLIHDPRSNFHTPTSLKTQTARCISLLLPRHLCKHFFIPQLHVPKHHFSDAHTHMLINTYETRFLSHPLKFKSAGTTSLQKKTQLPWRNCLKLDWSISRQTLDWQAHLPQHCKIAAVKHSSFSCPYHTSSRHPWNLYWCFVDNTREFSGYNLNLLVYPSTCLAESI